MTVEKKLKKSDVCWFVIGAIWLVASFLFPIIPVLEEVFFFLLRPAYPMVTFLSGLPQTVFWLGSPILFSALVLVFTMLGICTKRLTSTTQILLAGFFLPAVFPILIQFIVHRNSFADGVDRMLSNIPLNLFLTLVLVPEVVALIIFLLTFFVLGRRLIRALVVTVVIYIALLLIGLFLLSSQATKSSRELCAPNREATGLITSVYFVEPITKIELEAMVSQFDLKVYRIGLKKTEYKYLLETYHDPQLDRDTISRIDWEKSFNPGVRNPLPEEEERQRQVSQLYELGEPVVLTLHLHNTFMVNLIDFYLEYDRNQQRLAVAIDPDTEQDHTGWLNPPPDWIRPKPSGYIFQVYRLCHIE